MDSKELLNLIRFVAKAGVSEVKYKTKDFEINIKTPLAGSEAVSYVPQPVAYQAPAAEAMKLFNQIEAEVSGKIVKILVDDASPVEYDQPLFLVDPS